MNDFEDKLAKQLEQTLKDILSEKNLEKIAQDIVDQIVLRTKLGKGVSQAEGPEKPLEKLSTSYKKQRKSLQSKGKLHETTTPTRSNLTQTGEMLDSIRYKINGEEITIYIEGEFNNKKANWQVDQKRSFLNISSVQKKRLINLINTQIQAAFKKNWGK